MLIIIQKTPIQRACYCGGSGIVSLLIKYGAKADAGALQNAVSKGYE